MQLHHVLVGDDGPFVIAIPGGPGFDHAHLRPGLDPLADSARIVYVDPRNTGRSPRAPLETGTIEQGADDIAELCAQLGIERAVMCGHSAGGFVALTTALRHPELVSGLLLLNTSPTFAPFDDPDPPPSLRDRAGDEAAEVARRMFAGDASRRTAMAFAVQVVPFYGGPEHMDVPMRLFRLSAINGEVTAYFFARLAREYDVRPRLGEIHVPALVVVGLWDWVVAPIRGRVLAAGLPDAQLLELSESGHLAFAEEPEIFLQAAREFLARVART